MAKAVTITRNRPLSDLQRLFVNLYTSQGQETYHNATKSAIAAGYTGKWVKDTGCQLLRKPLVVSAIAKIETPIEQRRVAQGEVNRQWMELELKEVIAMGKAAKDLAAVNAGLVTMGKLHGLLTDVVGFDPQQLKQLTEAQEREARRISSLILDNTITGTGNESAMLQSQPDIIPASNNSAMLQSCLTLV